MLVDSVSPKHVNIDEFSANQLISHMTSFLHYNNGAEFINASIYDIQKPVMETLECVNFSSKWIPHLLHLTLFAERSSLDGAIAESCLIQTRSALETIVNTPQLLHGLISYPTLPTSTDTPDNKASSGLGGWCRLTKTLMTSRLLSLEHLTNDGARCLQGLVRHLGSNEVRDFLSFLVCASKQPSIETDLIEWVTTALHGNPNDIAIQRNGSKLIR